MEKKTLYKWLTPITSLTDSPMKTKKLSCLCDRLAVTGGGGNSEDVLKKKTLRRSPPEHIHQCGRLIYPKDPWTHSKGSNPHPNSLFLRIRILRID